jgi:hypothetical protein
MHVKIVKLSDIHERNDRYFCSDHHDIPGMVDGAALRNSSV